MALGAIAINNWSDLAIKSDGRIVGRKRCFCQQDENREDKWDAVERRWNASLPGIVGVGGT